MDRIQFISLFCLLLLLQRPAQAQNFNTNQDSKYQATQDAQQVKEKFDELIHSPEFIANSAATNPSLQEISAYAEVLSATFKIPWVVLKAVMFQESSWRQFDQYKNPLVSGDGGIGIMQVTFPLPHPSSGTKTLGRIVLGAQGSNPFTIITESVQIDIERLKNDWKYNMEIGSRILLAKKDEADGSGDDATLLENWYYPLAFYNGFTKNGENDPANPAYSRTVGTKGSNWGNKDIFPYQECVYNIIAQLYPLPSEYLPFFGSAVKGTLPGPDKVNSGEGHYNYVLATFKGGDSYTFYRDNRAVINNITYQNQYTIAHVLSFGTRKPLSANMVSLNHQKFPFIYMNVAVDTFSVGFPDLLQSNFQVHENGVLQTDYFEVTPPEIGGGVRLADIIFLMDNSGSMEDEQDAVRNNVIDFVNKLAASGIDFALGLCRYGAFENSGNPIIEDSGILTSNAEYFKNDVWGRNVVDGRYEPGWDGLYQSANTFSFRPGSQKVFIIITDESPNHTTGGASDNHGTYSQSQTIGILESNLITVFALIPLIPAVVQDYGTIAETTNGQYFDIYTPFDDILSYISSQVANTYLVRYSSSDPVENGIERNVEVVVNYGGNQATATGSYIPGSAPHIQRTQNALELHNRPLAERTEIAIEVEIMDNVSPYVQNATLYFKKTSASSYQSTPMTKISENLWQGIIYGSHVETPGLDYYVTATDGDNTVSDPSVDPIKNPYQIAILPNVAPQITHTPVTTLTPNFAITISAEIIDNTNSLAGSKLYYRKTGQLIYQDVEMITVSVNYYEAEIPASFVTKDGVDYYIKAWDDFGVSGYYGTPDVPQLILETSPPTPGTLDNKNIYAYPNPFSPDRETGTMRYSLSNSGNVTIKIYDTANVLVKTIVEGTHRDGGVELAEQWDGRNENRDIVANGVYFYVIESSAGERGIGKIAVLR